MLNKLFRFFFNLQSDNRIAAKMSIPPYNFSWIVPEKIAGMAVPKELENLQYLVDAGVEHLISLSEERLPYNNVKDFPNLKWTLISVEEFEPPTLDDIHKFFRICVECHRKNKAIGVHCRQGLGRTGVMLACYLMVYQDLTPGNALTRIRLMRPWSVETYEQERIVFAFHDHLRSMSESKRKKCYGI